jgi:NitT/TauT family transport system permease protein
LGIDAKGGLRIMSFNKMRRYVWIVTFIVIIGGWEAIVRLLNVPDFILPPPSVIVVSLWEGLTAGTILSSWYYTLYETIGGFIIAMIIGITLGALISQFEIVDMAIYPYIVAFEAVPKVAFAPLLLIWFGFGLTSKVVMAGLISFFCTLITTMEGIHNTPVARVDLMRSLGATKWQIFWMVKWKSALHYIFAGIQTAIVYSLSGAIVGEFTGSQVGLGNLILLHNFKMDISGVFSVLIVLSITGVVLSKIVRFTYRKLVFWKG